MHAGTLLGIALPIISVLFLQASILISEEEDVCIGLDGDTLRIIDNQADDSLSYSFNGSVDVLLLIEASIYSVPYLAATLDGAFNDENIGFMSQLKSRFSDVRVAVSGFTNKAKPLAGPGPFGGWNEFASSYCYQNFSPFTRDMLAISEAFGQLMGGPVMIGQPSKLTNTLRGNMFDGIINAINDPALDWRESTVGPIKDDQVQPVFDNAQTGKVDINGKDNRKIKSSQIKIKKSRMSNTDHETSLPLTSLNAMLSGSLPDIASEEQICSTDCRPPPSQSITPDKPSMPLTSSLTDLSSNKKPKSPPNPRGSPKVLHNQMPIHDDNRSREQNQCKLSRGKRMDQWKPLSSDISQRNLSSVMTMQGLSNGHVNIIVVLFNVLSYVEDPKEEFEEFDLTYKDWNYVEYNAGESILKTLGGYPSCAWRRADPEIAHGIFEGDYRSFDNTASMGIYADLIKTLKLLNICLSTGGSESPSSLGGTACDNYYRDSSSFVDGIFNLTLKPGQERPCSGSFPSYEDVITALNDKKRLHLAALIGNGQNNPFVYYDDCRALGSTGTFAYGGCYAEWAATYLPNATTRIIPQGSQDLTQWLLEVVYEVVDSLEI